MTSRKHAVSLFFIPLIICRCFFGGSGGTSEPIIADHSTARLSVLESIPDSAINNAKSELVIAYGHTSHGSQIVSGVDGLNAFMNGKGAAVNLYSDRFKMRHWRLHQ